MLASLEDAHDLYFKQRPCKRKYLLGMGIVDTFKDLASSLVDNVAVDLVKAVGKKTFQLAANEYRKRYCNSPTRDLLYGEFHPYCENYTGPGTRIDISNVRNYPPHDGIDSCSRQHDIEYDNIGKSNLSKQEKARKIQEADRKAISCYEQYPNEKPYRLAKLGLKGKLGAEQLLSSLKGEPSTFYGGRFDRSLDKRLRDPTIGKISLKKGCGCCSECGRFD